METADDEAPLTNVDAEIKQLLGAFDVPAFARRGAELDQSLARLDARLRQQRSAMLEMVRLRLRQWAAAASGSESALTVFTTRIDDLWPAAGAAPPIWAAQEAPWSRLRAAGRDLLASIERFNGRWTKFLAAASFDRINQSIDDYNRYYLLEKECSLGSSRLAARFWTPQPPIDRAEVASRYPTLRVPVRRP